MRARPKDALTGPVPAAYRWGGAADVSGGRVRRSVWAMVALLGLVLACSPAGPATAERESPRPGRPAAPIPGTTCTVFPPDNIWNADISGLPVHPKSAAWLASMEASTTKLHPDFGRPPYGLPFAVVDDSHSTTSVRFLYDDESDPGTYPFGPDIPLEQGSDRHALMVNGNTCVLYELYAANWNGGNPRAGSGAIFDLGSNALRPDTWTSADAAGMPILSGLVRYDEVVAGSITHAIRFTADLTDCSHLWPARHDAGTCNPNFPPMGARFRLKASFSLSGFNRSAKVILRAMKRYGLFMTDNGSNFYFQGTEDSRWPDRLLDQLKTVPGSAFQAVDESCLMIDPDSAQAKSSC
jgi:hypothetical protein